MKEICLSGKRGAGLCAIVDDDQYEYLNHWKWNLDKYGYAVRHINVDGKSRTIRMHQLIMHAPAGVEVDHIDVDGSTLDNRRWVYPKLAALVAVAVCLATGAPRVAMAMALHGLMDFTFQPPWMCAAKARGDRGALALHAVLAGGVAGWAAGGLPGALVGVATHGAIDAQNKFGLRGLVGLALDQALHAAVIVAIGVAFGSNGG